MRRIATLLVVLAPLSVALVGQAPPGGRGQTIITRGGGSGVLVGPRRQIVQALAREEDDTSFATLLAALYHADALVRREAAYGLAHRLIQRGFGPQVLKAREVLQARLAVEFEDGDAGRTMLRALGELPYDPATGRSVERFLVEEAGAHIPDRVLRRLGAAEGLEALSRQGALPEIEPATRARLHELVLPFSKSNAPQEPFLPALQALQAAGDNSDATILAAARYHCRGAVSPTCGWQFRRIAAQMIDAADDAYSEIFRELLRDRSFHVRLEAIRGVAARVAVKNDCQPIVDAFTDEMPIVAAEAMNVVDPRCAGKDDIVERLKPVANDLLDPDKKDLWFLPVRAFSALARLSPEDAKKMLPDVARHPEWAVRSAAARAAGVLGNATVAVALAGDVEARIRTDALTALMNLNSAQLPDIAREELDRLRTRGEGVKLPDPGSLWNAATALKERVRPDDFPALLNVLSLPVTFRIARLAAIDRISELAKPDESGVSPLRNSTRDIERAGAGDYVVALRIADLIEIITGKRPTVVPPRRTSTVGSVARSWEVLIRMAKGDQIIMELEGEEAPATVGRFAGREYRGAVFHRLLPNLLIQGGSLSGSDWSVPQTRPCRADVNGVTVLIEASCDFWMDELNPLRHERGTVALATNGPDTGIGQFFVNLVDQPAFNHRYTVFGRISCVRPAHALPFLSSDPIDLIDAFTEGEEILKIEGPQRKVPKNNFICAGGN